jgi:predicted RNA binding protein YcfA (HicA-like mRNA interferase family)
VSRLKLIDFRMMDRLLRKLGFEISRQKGSHVFYRHPDGRTTVVPNHGSKDLARPLIADILKDIGLTMDQYQDELDRL